ncbi:hypothetical protein B0G52_113102 [Cohnella sp. SGD-V74]|nr:hypothetical protein B0G52_113102 [Cohnella sp. SGD-V74]
MSKEMTAIYEKNSPPFGPVPGFRRGLIGHKRSVSVLNGGAHFYSLEAFKGLGKLYVNDERLKSTDPARSTRDSPNSHSHGV